MRMKSGGEAGGGVADQTRHRCSSAAKRSEQALVVDLNGDIDSESRATMGTAARGTTPDVRSKRGRTSAERAMEIIVPDHDCINITSIGSLLARQLSSDHSRELHNLVEDKEIAARAVAFVVNSTRKGIVPLCADVASLLRAKRRMESKILRLRTDNDKLRASLSASSRTSNSTSPLPASIHSCDQHQQGQCSQCYCSDCSSPCDSMVSDSPKPDKSFSSRVPCTRGPGSAFAAHTHGYHSAVGGLTPVHSNGGTENGLLQQAWPCCADCERKNSLPEMVSEPSANLVRVRPTVSTETQCSLVDATTCTGLPLVGAASGSALEAQFGETLAHNARLAEQLGAAKKEIELLKGKLRELEMNQLAREAIERFHTENEVQSSPTAVRAAHSPGRTCAQHHHHPTTQSASSDACSCGRARTQAPNTTAATSRRHHMSPHRIQPSASNPELGGASVTGAGAGKMAMATNMTTTQYCSSNTGTVKRKGQCPLVVASPLEGCLCGTCSLSNGTKPHALYQASNRPKVEVLLNDHVVLKGEKTGHVRYLGHLDGVGQPQVVFAGVELDAPVGRHDGVLNGNRYFSCAKDCGIFVPLHEVCCVIAHTFQAVPNTSCDLPKPIRRGAVERSSSGRDPASPTSVKGSRREKEKRFTPTEMDLTLPKNSQLTEDHLV